MCAIKQQPLVKYVARFRQKWHFNQQKIQEEQFRKNGEANNNFIFTGWCSLPKWHTEALHYVLLGYILLRAYNMLKMLCMSLYLKKIILNMFKVQIEKMQRTNKIKTYS